VTVLLNESQQALYVMPIYDAKRCYKLFSFLQGTNVVIKSVISVFKCAFVLDAENVPHPTEDQYLRFSQCFLQILEDFLGQFRQHSVDVPPDLLGAFDVNSFFKKSPQKSGAVRSGDRNGHFPRPTLRSPKESCNKPVVMLAVWAVAQSCRNQQSFSFSSNRKVNVSKDFERNYSLIVYSNNNGSTIFSRCLAPNTIL
jgi:hypothetical protein